MSSKRYVFNKKEVDPMVLLEKHKGNTELALRELIYWMEDHYLKVSNEDAKIVENSLSFLSVLVDLHVRAVGSDLPLL